MAERSPLLSDDEITEALAGLDGWRRDGDVLVRELQFDDFVGAFAFMTGVALVAEKLFHHPEWSNVYNKVSIAITTHDSGGITGKDIEFARKVDALAR